MATRTYSVGANCNVRRLDNLTGPWISVPYSPLTPTVLRDVETDTVSSDIVYAVGTTGTDAVGGSFFGIIRSLDAGVTWKQPSALLGGNYTSLRNIANFTFYEVSVVDSNVIYACGDFGWVVKSVDGGQSFNKVTQLPAVKEYVGDPTPAVIKPVTSIHFITPLIGVVGISGNVFKTIDGGNTWVYLNGAKPVAANNGQYGGEFYGIFISQDSQRIVALGRTTGTPARIFTSTNGGVSFLETYLMPDISGYHLTWTDDQHLWAFGQHEHRISSIDGGLTWNVLQLASYNGRNDYAGHFYSNTDGFYSEVNEVYNTTDAGNTVKTLSETAPYTVEALWTKVSEDVELCYVIKDCEGIQPDFVTSSDMSQYVGKTIKTCITGGDPSQRNPEPVVVGNQTCYRFENCCDPNEIIQYQANSFDLVQWPTTGGGAPNLLGQTILFVNTGKCWKCIFSGDCDDPPPTTNPNPFPGPYQWYPSVSCEECMQSELFTDPCSPPPPPPPVDPPQAPEYLYLLSKCCDPEIQIVVNTTSATLFLPGFAVSIPSIPVLGDGCWLVNNLPQNVSSTGSVNVPTGTTVILHENCEAAPCKCVKYWPEGCYCVTIEIAPNCIGSAAWNGVVTDVYDSCEECEEKCYRLIDCAGIEADIIVSNDFSGFVGQIVQLRDCPDTCWQVEECPECENCICVHPVETVFETCEDCLPPVPEPPPLELHPRRVKPGYYTPGCPPAYTEKVNCNFGDQMYNQMLIGRYGITICCEDDRIKWDIKKQLLELAAIYDPSLCVNYIEPCYVPCEPLYFGTDNLEIEIVNTIPVPSLTLNFNDFFLSMAGGVAPFTYSMSKDGITWVSDTDPLNVFLTWGCADLGINTIYFRIEDSCLPPQSVVITSTLTILDPLNLCNPCANPTPLCKNGLVRELSLSGTIEVFAQDFDAGSFDNPSNTNPGIATYEISRDNITYGPSIIFDCADVDNLVVVYLRVTNNCGASDFCETAMLIVDPMGVCGGP